MLFQYGYFNWKTFDYAGCNLRFSRWGGGWGGGGGERVGNKSRLLTVKTTREKRESISRRYDSSIDKAGSRVEGWRARGFGGWPGCKQPFLWTIKQYRKISRSSCFQFNRPNGKLFATPAKYREAVAKLRVETPGFPSRERGREREGERKTETWLFWWISRWTVTIDGSFIDPPGKIGRERSFRSILAWLSLIFRARANPHAKAICINFLRFTIFFCLHFVHLEGLFHVSSGPLFVYVASSIVEIKLGRRELY